MLHGMMAFARCQESTVEFEIIWELRSANHRFLDLQFRLPDQLRALEPRLRDAVSRQLKRGSLICVLTAKAKGKNLALELNRPLLLQLLAILEQVRRDVPEANLANPMELLQWPGMLQGATGAPPKDVVVATLETAIERLLQSRVAEGAKLHAGIIARLDEIERLVDEFGRLTADLPNKLSSRLKKRLAELEANVANDRLQQEVALLAQKADTAEEIDRLNIHIEDARSHLSSAGPHGRRLDFLAQELIREANTLGAKAVLPSASQVTVDLKVAIEQIREQAQNIE